MKESLGLGIDYLGGLSTHLRDLLGYATLAHELIQNADDVEQATWLSFDVRDDALIVENNAPFSECDQVDDLMCAWEGKKCDFHRFRTTASGDKRNADGTTGAFGIGFIAVYQVTDRPELHSRRRHWTIAPDSAEAERITQRRGEERAGTWFRFPWATDPNSTVRKGLRLQAVKTGEVAEALLLELSTALPRAMLFLRRLERISLLRNGKKVKVLERLTEQDAAGRVKTVIISDNGSETLWHLFHGEFVQDAARLRAQYSAIETKRVSDVTVAVSQDATSADGLFAAFLPTQQPTGFAAHINADFYPSSDRKRILFDAKYETEWNEAAVRAAARTLTAALPQFPELLGAKATWAMISDWDKLNRDVADRRQPAAFGAFWKEVAPHLSKTRLLETTVGRPVLPSEALLLLQPTEEENTPVLEAIGVSLVHPDLRPFMNILRSAEVGVALLDASGLARALAPAAGTEAVAYDEAASWLRDKEMVAALGRELLVLCSRNPGNGVAELAGCAIALATGGEQFERPDQLLQADHDTESVFRAVTGQFADRVNVPGVMQLVPVLDVAAAIGVLEAVPAARFVDLRAEAPDRLAGIIRWFAQRQADLSAEPDLQERLGALPIWPTGETVLPLTELAVPGSFNDPLRLTHVVDMELLAGLGDFLRFLGATELTVATYASDFVPRAFAAGDAVGAEDRRALVRLLAEHAGQLVDQRETLAQLAGLQLVECTDGTFKEAKSVYFNTPTVASTLGKRAAVAKSWQSENAAVKAFLGVLGVRGEPRPQDIVQRIEALVSATPSPTPSVRSTIQGVVKYIGAGWAERKEEWQANLAVLRSMAWLPAKGNQEGWFKPADLFTEFQAYLFRSQGRFVDLDQAVQQSVAAFLEDLGVRPVPPCSLVVKHLLHCARQSEEVSPQVYVYLNQQAKEKEPAINALLAERCLLVAGANYVRPDEVYWEPHPFGHYRHTLGESFRACGALLTALKVKQAPDAEDALKVLREISQEYGARNRALDGDTQAIVLRCWQLLEGLSDDKLGKLAAEKVVPNQDGILYPPQNLYFEDRPLLAAKFGQFLRSNVVPKAQGAWRAMQAAGVQLLSDAVQVELVQLDGAQPAGAEMQLLRGRLRQVRRVLEAFSEDGEDQGGSAKLAHVTLEEAKHLLTRHVLKAFDRVEAGPTEASSVYFDAERSTLYFVRKENRPPWPAIARELVYAIVQEAEAGLIATGLNGVFGAATTAEADAVLDELGYAPLKGEVAPAAQVAVAEMGGATEEAWSVVPADQGQEEQAKAPEGGAHREADNEPREQSGAWESDDADSSDTEQDEEFDQDYDPDDDQVDDDTHASGAERENSPSDHTGDGSGAEARGRRGRTRGTGARSRGAAEASRQAAGRQGGKGQQGPRPSEPSRGREFISYVAAHPDEERDPDYLDHDARMALEDHAIELILSLDKRLERTPRNTEGFDLVEKGDGQPTRWVEVKAMKGSMDDRAVGMSAAQFRNALLHGEDYWLYIVEYAGDPEKARLVRIQDPAGRAKYFTFDKGWRSIAAPDLAAPRGNVNAVGP